MPKKESVAKTQKKKVKTNKSGKAVQKLDMNMYFTEIQQRAYEKFLTRQGENKEGNDFSDWIQAEEEITTKYQNV